MLCTPSGIYQVAPSRAWTSGSALFVLDLRCRVRGESPVRDLIRGKLDCEEEIEGRNR
jgi:hypothetical protein